MIAVACSSSTPTPDPDVPSFCSDWAKGYCQISATCQIDATACVTYQTSVCTSFANTAEASGSRKYSQPNGKACIDAINNAFQGNPTGVSATVLTQLDTTCNRAFTGNQAANQSCSSDYDCQSGLVCGAIPGQTTKLCGSVTSKSLGQACADPGDTCASNSYCAPVAGTIPQCVATPQTGGACSATIPCGASDRCVNNVCTPRAKIGESCASNADCDPNAPYCDLYPPAACTTGLGFARGSADCKGIGGSDIPVSNPDSGVVVNPVDASSPDSSSPADAASGG
jgi:hypothetical protein